MRGLCADESGVSPVVAVLLLLAIFMGAHAIYMTVTVPGQFAFKEKEHMSEVQDSFLRLQRAIKNVSEQGTQSIHVPMSVELFSGGVRGPSAGGTLSTGASFIDYTTVGCWLMDEGSGDNVYDETKYQNHGLRYGATWASGRENVGIALSFDGNDYVNCDNKASLNVTVGITIQAWIYWKGSAFDGRIANKSKGATKTGYMLLVDSANKIKFRLGNGNFTELVGPVISLNQWYHVAATWSTSDNNKMRIYVNGRENVSGNFVGPILNATVPFVIGKASDADEEYFNGIIDSVVIYNRALSKDEIKAYHNRQVSCYGVADCYIKNFYYSPQRYIYEDGAVILVQDNKSLMVSMPSLITVEDREGDNVEVRVQTVRLLGSGETSGVGAGVVTIAADNFHSTPVTSTPNLENLTIIIYSEYRDAWGSYLLWLAEDYLSSRGIHATVDFKNLQLTLHGKVSAPDVKDIYLVKEYREIDTSLF